LTKRFGKIISRAASEAAGLSSQSADRGLKYGKGKRKRDCAALQKLRKID
jgi:hypothetical protein